MASETVKTESKPAEMKVRLVRRWRAIGWIKYARERLLRDGDEVEKARVLIVVVVVPFGVWAEYGIREVDATGSNRVQLVIDGDGGGGDISPRVVARSMVMILDEAEGYQPGLSGSLLEG